MARENLDITTVMRQPLLRHPEHRRQRVGATGAGPKALSMLDLHRPEMNWLRIATGLGVEASRATTTEEFIAQYGSAMKQRGPR
jgi:acetolactate synthase-1/2/3 large subunit